MPISGLHLASNVACAYWHSYIIWVAPTRQDKTNGDPIAKFANSYWCYVYVCVCQLKFSNHATHMQCKCLLVFVYEKLKPDIQIKPALGISFTIGGIQV
jgi:hypothetical protein